MDPTALLIFTMTAFGSLVFPLASRIALHQGRRTLAAIYAACSVCYGVYAVRSVALFFAEAGA